MKIIIVKDYQEMSNLASKIINRYVEKNPQSVLGLATGSTPEGTYQNLIKLHQSQKTNYQKIKVFNLDEYVFLKPNYQLSYAYYMQQKLFQKINIDLKNTFIPQTNGDLDQNALNYEKLIKAQHGIDLQLLGIGQNGHIGFNEPGSSFDSLTRVVDLTSSTIKANSRYFQKIEDVPQQAISMGLKTIMNAKEILLLASGKTKAQAIKDTIMGTPTTQVPASILQKHPKVTIIIDKLASSLLINDQNFSKKYNTIKGENNIYDKKT